MRGKGSGRGLSSRWLVLSVCGLFASGGCEGELGPEPEPVPAEAAGGITCSEPLPYASEVVAFTPGAQAGYGQDGLPEVALGPPASGPPSVGSLDVVSLGIGGEIILSFGDREVLDGPGPDLIVWENAFWAGGDPDKPFAELGEVSVSSDGHEWHTFACDPDALSVFDEGCAGWRPRLTFDPCEVLPLDPDRVGGDTFDLADLGLSTIRYVRIRDLSGQGAAPSAGFDLDAVGAVTLSP